MENKYESNTFVDYARKKLKRNLISFFILGLLHLALIMTCRDYGLTIYLVSLFLFLIFNNSYTNYMKNNLYKIPLSFSWDNDFCTIITLTGQFKLSLDTNVSFIESKKYP